jgi:hypothetical protein
VRAPASPSEWRDRLNVNRIHGFCLLPFLPGRSLFVPFNGRLSDPVQTAADQAALWNYIAIAKASFQQRADKADLPEDSFGSLTLDFDDGESIETLDECTAWFGRVSIFDIITPPHHDVIGGMTGGVAVIDALVRAKRGSAAAG